MLTMLVPSRRRPEAARDLCVHSFVTFVVDQDDLTAESYPPRRTLVVPGGTMVKALNQALSYVYTPFVGFMGDDHRPAEFALADLADVASLDAQVDGAAMTYGNDLFQGENLPTAIVMSTHLVRAIGFMAPPVLRHLYVDNYWLELGRALGILKYVPEVVIEHMHPAAGKSEWTEGHLRVNDQALYNHDRAAWEEFKADGSMAAAVERGRAVLR